MTKEELEKIIEKNQNLSSKLYPQNETKSYHFSQFADWIEYNIDTLEDVDDFATDEEELWNNFLEAEAEGENWDSIFPEGDDDDSITDWMTKD